MYMHVYDHIHIYIYNHILYSCTYQTLDPIVWDDDLGCGNFPSHCRERWIQSCAPWVTGGFVRWVVGSFPQG